MIQVRHNVRNTATFGKVEAPTGFVGFSLAGCRGALAGVIGRLVRVRSRARLVLSVEGLAQSVATQMEAWDIEPTPVSKPVASNNTGRMS